jgi:hypothetical protein
VVTHDRRQHKKGSPKMATQTKIKFRTAKGRAQYPHLDKIDTGMGNNYKTNLILAPADAEKIMAECLELGKETFGSKAKLRMPWKEDAETGDIILITKTNYQPRFVDGDAKPVAPEKCPPLWGGSILKLAGTIATYEMTPANKGVTLYLEAVQIIEPVGGGAGGGANSGPEDAGFDADDSGWKPTSDKGGDDLDDFTDF